MLRYSLNRQLALEQGIFFQHILAGLVLMTSSLLSLSWRRDAAGEGLSRADAQQYLVNRWGPRRTSVFPHSLHAAASPRSGQIIADDYVLITFHFHLLLLPERHATLLAGEKERKKKKTKILYFLSFKSEFFYHTTLILQQVFFWLMTAATLGRYNSFYTVS